jgi:excisionase family DNA binding protein
MQKINPDLNATPQKYLRLGAAALYSGVSIETLKRWIREGLIRASRPSCRLTLVEKASLDAHLAGNEVKQAAV